ncbi:hypothetical protein cand_017090 [Cryptosporidium andersoni]|uniref:Uncharacterized protein n=1 Tax=Cryptosporidium andersoni TaxID=117008 RepID=A0A1J4MX96_9CRYT|nr:hypothetical protein cand_017090 [Cryptosporidium andersoni]
MKISIRDKDTKISCNCSILRTISEIINTNNGNNYSVRPSILVSLCSAFSPSQRGLVESVTNILFSEFLTKSKISSEDASYNLCIPSMYSVLLLTICHVHNLAEHEEEWFVEFLKNRKFPILTPSGFKSEILLNLLNALACFGSSLKRRPSNMQRLEVTLLRLGISFYISLYTIMDHSFSTNRFVRALIVGVYSWIHGTTSRSFTSNLTLNQRGLFDNTNNKIIKSKVVQDHIVRNLISLFDDFSIQLIFVYGYRPHSVTWADIDLYIKSTNDPILENIFILTTSDKFFFNIIPSICSSYCNYCNHMKDDFTILSNTQSNIIKYNTSSTSSSVTNLSDECNTIPMVSTNSVSNSYVEDIVSQSGLTELEYDDELDCDELFHFKNNIVVPTKNNNLSISSKLHDTPVSTSDKLFNFNRINNKILNNGRNILKSSVKFGINLGIKKHSSWSQFVHMFGNYNIKSDIDNCIDISDKSSNQDSHKKDHLTKYLVGKDIYECEDWEDPLNVL